MRIRISPLVLFISSMVEQNTSNIWTQVRLLDENRQINVICLDVLFPFLYRKTKKKPNNNKIKFMMNITVIYRPNLFLHTKQKTRNFSSSEIRQSNRHGLSEQIIESLNQVESGLLNVMRVEEEVKRKFDEAEENLYNCEKNVRA